jgi:hypothetical protein
MRRFLPAVALLLFVTLPAFARSKEDRTTLGGDITVSADETVNDIACVFCTVRVHGDVRGDVAVMFGSILVDSDRSIGGDVAAMGGDLQLGEDAVVKGDVAIMAGDARLASGAAIRGSRSVLPGRFWLLLPLLPLLLLAGIIWLIVWIVRRNRYRFPAYPNGRGF